MADTISAIAALLWPLLVFVVLVVFRRPLLRVLGSVLWVDDHPENNAILVGRLQAAGIRVDLAESTREGRRLFDQRRFAAGATLITSSASALLGTLRTE